MAKNEYQNYLYSTKTIFHSFDLRSSINAMWLTDHWTWVLKCPAPLYGHLCWTFASSQLQTHKPARVNTHTQGSASTHGLELGERTPFGLLRDKTSHTEMLPRSHSWHNHRLTYWGCGCLSSAALLWVLWHPILKINFKKISFILWNVFETFTAKFFDTANTTYKCHRYHWFPFWFVADQQGRSCWRWGLVLPCQGCDKHQAGFLGATGTKYIFQLSVSSTKFMQIVFQLKPNWKTKFTF